MDTELSKGKLSITLCCPLHCVLIKCGNGELPGFLHLLRKLSNKNFAAVSGLPTISVRDTIKFSSKSRVSSCMQSSKNISINAALLQKVNYSHSYLLSYSISNSYFYNVFKSFQIKCVKIREQLHKSLTVLDLPNSQIKNLPVQLGEISWLEIDLRGNDLTNADLIFLEEMPVRKSLIRLDLRNNKVSIRFTSILLHTG